MASCREECFFVSRRVIYPHTLGGCGDHLETTYEIRTSRFCVSRLRNSRDTNRSHVFCAALWFGLSHTAWLLFPRCAEATRAKLFRQRNTTRGVADNKLDALMDKLYLYHRQSNSIPIAPDSGRRKFPKLGQLPLCEVRRRRLIAILHNSFLIAGSSIGIVLTVSIPTLLPFTAALPSFRPLLPRDTGKVVVTSDWSDPARPGWLHCFASGSWLPTQLITAPVNQVCAPSQSVEGISRLSFRSNFFWAPPIGRTPRNLRRISGQHMPWRHIPS